MLINLDFFFNVFFIAVTKVDRNSKVEICLTILKLMIPRLCLYSNQWCVSQSIGRWALLCVLHTVPYPGEDVLVQDQYPSWFWKHSVARVSILTCAQISKQSQILNGRSGWGFHRFSTSLNFHRRRHEHIYNIWPHLISTDVSTVGNEKGDVQIKTVAALNSPVSGPQLQGSRIYWGYNVEMCELCLALNLR